MPKYTFTFKKDDIYVEFVTTDRDVVEKQFQIWVNDASAYSKNKAFKKNDQIKPEEDELKEESKEEPHFEETKEQDDKEIELEINKEEEEQTQDNNQELSSENVEENIESEEVEEAEIEKNSIGAVEEDISYKIVDEKTEEIKTETKEEEVFENVSNFLKTINSIQNGAKEEEKKIEVKQVDFEDVLVKSIENPVFEPTKTTDESYLKLLKSKNVSDKFYYLMLTIHYLTDVERVERFSLKQINAKLMQNLSTVIDHTVLQQAINQKFVELIPDLTDSADTSEYRLTEIGESFIKNI